MLLLSAGAFFSGAALRVCDSLLPRLAGDFAITAGTAGRVIISFSVAYGLMQLVFGPLGDRFGKARVIGVSLAGCAAAALACALAPGFESLVALRILWGMAAAGVIPLALALIGDTVPYEHRQATLARLLIGILCGMTAGQLAGGLFADAAPGWRGAFATLAAGYAVIAALLIAAMRGHPPPVAAGAPLSFVPQLLRVLAVPWARVILLAVALEGIFLLGPMAYFPAYLNARHGLSLAAASALVALYAVGGLVYAVAARRLVQDWGERRMVLTGGVLTGGGLLAFWLSPWGLAAAPVTLVLGFGAYLLHNTLHTHATQMAPEVRGTAVALFAFCLFAGQAIGVSAAGAVLDRFGFAPVLGVPAAVLVVTGAWLARALASRAAG